MKSKSLLIRLIFLTMIMFCALRQQAQVITSCNDPEGGIQIWFDYNQNCPNSPGSLAGLQEIGFHSGANGWASVVEWDKPNAVHGINNGNDVYIIDINNPDTYYNVATTAINFVFNQGPANGAEPWGAEGKEDNGAGGCNDFYLPLSAITATCPLSAGINDLLTDKHLTIFPNPVADLATIQFENNTHEDYTIRIINAMGRTIDQEKDFNGNTWTFRNNRYAAGIYMVTLTNKKGQFFSNTMLLK